MPQSIPTQPILQALAPFGVAPSPEQLEALALYGDFMLEYNEKVNLTAITDPTEVAVRHFADSLALLGLVELPQGVSLIDVGTGAGFPGVPLKLLRPDLQLTLLDSLQKRLVFLQQLGERLGQQNTLVHARAEIAGADPALRAKFDYATCRAVAQLAVLCEYCLPLLRVGGKMLAMKGGDCQAEIDAAQNAIRVLGGRLSQVTAYTLGDGDETLARTLIVVEKIIPTAPKFPRQRVKLNQKPL